MQVQKSSCDRGFNMCSAHDVLGCLFVKQETFGGNRQLHALMCLGLIDNIGSRVTAVIYAPFESAFPSQTS